MSKYNERTTNLIRERATNLIRYITLSADALASQSEVASDVVELPEDTEYVDELMGMAFAHKALCGIGELVITSYIDALEAKIEMLKSQAEDNKPVEFNCHD